MTDTKPFSALPGQVDSRFQIDVDDFCGPAHWKVRLGLAKSLDGLLVPSVELGFIYCTGGVKKNCQISVRFDQVVNPVLHT